MSKKRKPNVGKIVMGILGLMMVSAMVLGPLLSFLEEQKT
jgi:hypothetical protein